MDIVPWYLGSMAFLIYHRYRLCFPIVRQQSQANGRGRGTYHVSAELLEISMLASKQPEPKIIVRYDETMEITRQSSHTHTQPSI